MYLVEPILLVFLIIQQILIKQQLTLCKHCSGISPGVWAVTRTGGAQSGSHASNRADKCQEAQQGSEEDSQPHSLGTAEGC